MDLFLLFVGLSKLRIHFQGPVYGHIQLRRDHFCDHVHLGIGHIQHTAHIPDHTPGSQGTKSNDLHHPVLAILFHHIIDHFLAPFKAKVHVNIRHRYTLRIQKTLKKKIIFDRIQPGDPQRIGYQASGCRTPSRPHHNIMIPGIFNKIPYDQEIIHIAHVSDGIQFVLQAGAQFLRNRMIISFQSLMAELV